VSDGADREDVDPAGEPVPVPPRPPAGDVPAAHPPLVGPPSDDVDPAAGDSTLPGVHRGGYSRLPTMPVGVVSQSAPPEPGTATEPGTASSGASGSGRSYAGWALAAAVLGLTASFFVGWAFPVGIVAIVLAAVALRRPLERRPLAWWAIALGALSLAYSAGWLVWAAFRTGMIA
jgi:hypothetical protein